MHSILFTRFASLLRRWVDALGMLVSNRHRLTGQDRSPDFRGGNGALQPAYVRIDLARERK